MSTLTITLEVPESISTQGQENAAKRAKEFAIISLWQDGELSTRQAADALALTYYDFLNLLSGHRIPVEAGGFRQKVVDSAAKRSRGE